MYEKKVIYIINYIYKIFFTNIHIKIKITDY